jgi:hypothetical protein
MYKQIFFAPVPYRRIDDPSLGDGILINVYIAYPDLVLAYGEVIHSVYAFFVNAEATASSLFTIILAVNTRDIHHVFTQRILKFDGTTGAFLGYEDPFYSPPGYLYSEVVQSIDGSLWATTVGYLIPLDPETRAAPDSSAWIPATFFEIPSDQEFHEIHRPMVDRARDIIIMSATPVSVDGRYILVNRLSTGALLRKIWVSGPIAQIIQEDDRRCFVVCTNGILNVVDFTTGAVISTTSSPAVHSVDGQAVYAWAPSLRRLLAFNFIDAGRAFHGGPPVNSDGSSPDYITGYYPVPIATNVTRPIPIKPPRKGRTVPMLVRTVGDSGEAIPSLPIAATATLPGSIGPGSLITDAYGYATINLVGTDAGSSDVTVTANVGDVYLGVVSSSGTGGGTGGSTGGSTGGDPGAGTIVPTLYVSTTGSDSNSGTSAASPFLTIQKAVTVATAGDIVSVASGTYAETIYGTNDGTVSQPIKFVSATKWGAKIVPPTANSSRDTAWDHRGDYVTIDGFEIDGTVDPVSGQFWRVGINVTGTNSLVTRCHVHHIHRNHDANSNGGAGILCDSYYGQNGGSATCNLVHHIGPSSGVGGSFVQGIYFTTAQARIENNVVNNVTGYGIHGWHDVRNTRVTNNTAFHNGEGGFVVGGGDYVNQSAPCDYMVVTNNIAYGNTGYGFSEQGDNGAHNIWSNNLANGNGTDWSLNTSSHVNDVTGSPGFVNYQADGSGDYHLHAGSPAIGTGLATYAPAIDFSGVTRTSPFDLGAYKFIGA